MYWIASNTRRRSVARGHPPLPRDQGFDQGPFGVRQIILPIIMGTTILRPGGPRTRRLAGEARVSAQHDLYCWPAGTDTPDDPLHLLERAGVDVRPPELCRQKVVAAEDVERQVAVAVIVAMEEPSLLAPVQRVVGRVEIKHQPFRHILVGVEKQVYEQRFDPARVMPMRR